MSRSWILAAGLIVALAVTAAFVRRSSVFRPTATTPTRTPSTAEESSPAGLVPPGATPSAKKTPPSPLHAAAQAKVKAMADVLRLLDDKGGAAALQRIRDVVLRVPTSIEDGLSQAFYARLIPQVAVADPSALPAALALAGEILRSTVATPWARVQVAAGLTGRNSATAIPVSDGRGYSFQVEPFNPTLDTPFQASLLEAARRDPGLGASLPAILGQERDRIVRRELVLAVGAVGGVGSPDALRRTATTDPDADVRVTVLETGSPELPEIARGMARADADADNQAAALELLGKTSAADPSTRRFLEDCLASQEPREALPSLARCTFSALAAGPSPALQDGLTRLLLQHAADPGLADAFCREAVERGLPHFLPLLRSMEASLPPGSESAKSLSLAAKQLEEAPRYAAMAQKLKAGEAPIRALLEESAKPDTPDARRAEIQRLVSAQMSELWALERELGR